MAGVVAPASRELAVGNAEPGCSPINGRGSGRVESGSILTSRATAVYSLLIGLRLFQQEKLSFAAGKRLYAALPRDGPWVPGAPPSRRKQAYRTHQTIFIVYY